jgi:hypothetical protein
MLGFLNRAACPSSGRRPSAFTAKGLILSLKVLYVFLKLNKQRTRGIEVSFQQGLLRRSRGGL